MRPPWPSRQAYVVCLAFLVLVSCNLSSGDPVPGVSGTQPAPRDAKRLWRGDRREPETIKRLGGFRTRLPPGSDAAWSIRNHVEFLERSFLDTIYVSATRSIEEADAFASPGEVGYTYQIQATPNAIDVNESYLMANRPNPHFREYEFVFLGGIGWEQVVGWQKVIRHNDKLIPQPFVRNPDYNSEYNKFWAARGQPQLLLVEPRKSLQKEVMKFMTRSENLAARDIGAKDAYAPSFCFESGPQRRDLGCVPKFGPSDDESFKGKWGAQYEAVHGPAELGAVAGSDAKMAEAALSVEKHVGPERLPLSASSSLHVAGRVFGAAGALQLMTSVTNSLVRHSLEEFGDSKATGSINDTLSRIGRVLGETLSDVTVGYGKLTASIREINEAMQPPENETILEALPRVMVTRNRGALALLSYLLRNVPVIGDAIRNVEENSAKEDEYLRNHPSPTWGEALRHEIEYRNRLSKGAAMDFARNLIPGIIEMESNSRVQGQALMQEIKQGRSPNVTAYMAAMWRGTLRDLKHHYIPLTELVDDGTLLRGNKTARTRALAGALRKRADPRTLPYPELLSAAFVEADEKARSPKTLNGLERRGVAT